MYHGNEMIRKLKIPVLVAGGLLFLTLLWSVVLSGFNYRFDADELFNANSIYLMLKGLMPYKDFYTVYSPILHWILTPVFLITGFNFSAIAEARAVMIGFFLIRLLLIFLLADRIFNRRIAVLSVVLYLLNPFTVFADMQIRPDNLMMLFYLLFLVVFISAVNTKSSRLYFLTGILLGITMLTNIKIIPSVVVFILVFTHFAWRNTLLKQLLLVFDGAIASFFVFFGYFFIQGYAPEMFLHVFLDAFRLNQSVPYPTWLGYFYFSNPVIYGFEGKPLNWMFAWMLPLIAFAGAYVIFKSSFREKKGQVVTKHILCYSLAAQWISMLFINSVFIQYYIPLNWLYGLFGAVFIDDLIFQSEIPSFERNILRGTIFLFFVTLTASSFFANINRSKWNSVELVTQYESLWAQIPENQPVFPNLLFRPTVYPILAGATFAPYMRDRYEPAYAMIEKKKLPYLVELNDEYFSYLDSESQMYIRKNYQPDPKDPRFWLKIEKEK